jgi:hypothetical protein
MIAWRLSLGASAAFNGSFSPALDFISELLLIGPGPVLGLAGGHSVRSAPPSPVPGTEVTLASSPKARLA